MKTFIMYQMYKITLSILILLIGLIIIKFINNNIKKMILNTNVDQTFISFSIQLINIAAILVIVLFILSILEISTNPLTASITAIMFGVGISLKNSASNLASGLLIISIRPFKISDIIEVNKIYGTVKNIELAFCTILTPDGKEIKIPNNLVTSSILTNFSTSQYRRNDFIISIECFNNIKKAKKILNFILNKDTRILKKNSKKPQPIVKIINITDNNFVEILSRYWTKRKDYLETKHAIAEKTIELFLSNKIITPTSYKMLDIQDRY